MVAVAAQSLEHEAVLCKALFRAQEAMGLTLESLGQVLGLERSSVNRLKKRGALAPEAKAGELALVLIRIYRSLYALVGEHPEALRHWLHSENRHLNGVPAELIKRVDGLVRVGQYLDALRGR